MKRILLAILLSLGVAKTVWADAIPTGIDSTTNGVQTQTVFNDAGREIVSNEIVVWDNDDTEFDRTGYRYVTVTTTTDSPWVAGVVVAGARCPDQSLCEIVTRGPAITKVADATDALVEDRLVSTSSLSGQAGDYTAAADTCFLGMAMELRDVDQTVDTGRDGSRMWVYVQPGCE